MVEAAGIEPASKTVVPTITTSVSSESFLDGGQARGRRSCHPVRL